MTDDVFKPILAVSRGYDGPQVAIQAILNRKTGVILVSKVLRTAAVRPSNPKVLYISDQVEDRPDVRFKPSDVVDSIQAAISNMNVIAEDGKPRLRFADGAEVISFSSLVESDGFDKSGQKFKINAMPNKAVALLSIIDYAWGGMSTPDSALDMGDALARLMRGEGVTI
mgnify:CR=1 FL=1